MTKKAFLNAKTVSPDVVLLVQVTFQSPVNLSQYKLKRDKFKRFDPATPRNMGYAGYIDNASGLVVQAYKGSVTQMAFIAALRDRGPCSGYYDKPRRFAAVFVELCCPSLNVSCPETEASPGKQLKFSASSSEEGASFHWTVTDGKIISGQDTSSILVYTTALEGKTITATVEMSFSGNRHTMTQSCSVQVAKPE